MSMPLRLAALTALLAALALPSAAQARAKTTYLVALGDSWAQGYQAFGPNNSDVVTNQGFNDRLYKVLRRSHPGLKLVKLGCGGATTDSMINGTKPCVEHLPYRSKSRRTSQLTYAADFIRHHRSQIAYVTVIIGGNDIAPCAAESSNAAIVACVGTGLNQIKKNVPIIARTLRRAAGRKPIIVGSTYADVVLGQYVKSDSGKGLAQLSVSIFKDQLNPALKSAYKKQRIGFVDATAGFGGYIPWSQTTNLAPYGQIPQAVANICELGWYCQPFASPDIHLRTAGYSKLGDEFAQVIRRHPRG